MIIDKIGNIGRYDLPQEAFKDLKHFLGKTNEWEFVKGKFEIKGDELFGIGLEYETKDASECLWEAHRMYIDIHLVLEGEEQIHISPISGMEEAKAYDETGDYELFEGEEKTSVSLGQGMFLILYPDEVHKTSVKLAKTNSLVKKVVFKLRYSL